MPTRTRPMTALLVFTGVNAILIQTIEPVYDFVCFLPYWERRILLWGFIASFSVLSSFFSLFSLADTGFTQRERRRKDREADSAKGVRES